MFSDWIASGSRRLEVPGEAPRGSTPGRDRMSSPSMFGSCADGRSKSHVHCGARVPGVGP